MITKFKVNDLIKVISQSKVQFHNLIGLYGFVEEVSKDGRYCSIHALQENGHVVGMGSMSAEHLEHCNLEWLKLAKEKHDKNFELAMEVNKKYTKSIEDVEFIMACKHNITTEVVKDIYNSICKAKDQWRD